MKTLYNDYKMFVGVTGRKTLLCLVGGFAAAIIALYAGNALLWNNEFIRGLLVSLRFVFVFCGSSPIFTVSSYSLPQTVGYKLFRSVPNSAVRYRNAILFGNIVAAVCMAFSAAVITAAEYICVGETDPQMLLLMLSISMIVVGILDCFGCIGNMIARFVGLMVVCSACGFVMGVFEDIDRLGYFFVAVGAAVWAAGIVFVLLTAKKQWAKER